MSGSLQVQILISLGISYTLRENADYCIPVVLDVDMIRITFIPHGWVFIFLGLDVPANNVCPEMPPQDWHPLATAHRYDA